MIISQTDFEKLLGRTLTSTEASNFEQHLNATIANLENLLGWSLLGEAGERVYKSRRRYHTLWTDPFTEINSVTVDGTAETDYTPIFNDSYNSPFYNGLEFDYPLDGSKVVIDATWGFTGIPADLGQLIVALWSMAQRLPTEQGNVRSKSIEDFSVTYTEDGEYNSIITTYSGVIAKYALDSSQIQHGDGYVRL